MLIQHFVSEGARGYQALFMLGKKPGICWIFGFGLQASLWFKFWKYHFSISFLSDVEKWLLPSEVKWSLSNVTTNLFSPSPCILKKNGFFHYYCYRASSCEAAVQDVVHQTVIIVNSKKAEWERKMKAFKARMDIQHQESASAQSKLDQKGQKVFENIRSVKKFISCEEVSSVITMLCL